MCACPLSLCVCVCVCVCVCGGVGVCDPYHWPSSRSFACLRSFIQPVVDAAGHAHLYPSCILLTHTHTHTHTHRHTDTQTHKHTHTHSLSSLPEHHTP